jgi:hypothetical protein
MWPKRTSFKIGGSLLAIFIGASLAVSLGAGAAAAATSRDRHAVIAAHRVHSAERWHHRPYVARGVAMPRYDYNHPNESAPGYVFVPGKGILNESCDLPTSACSNEYRDIE